MTPILTPLADQLEARAVACDPLSLRELLDVAATIRAAAERYEGCRVLKFERPKGPDNAA